MDSFIGDSGKYDLLGVRNGFRQLCELYIRQLVDGGKWFTVCHKIDPLQEDIMQVVNDRGVKLGSFISDLFEYGSYRTSIYKYMLMNFLCYVEVPVVSFRGNDGKFRNSFNKMLVTSNVEVIARWLDVSVSEVPAKYIDRVYGIDIDDGSDLLPYVRLSEGKGKVRKVSVPRVNIDVSERGTRVIPLFMLKAGVDRLYSQLCDRVVRVSFLKDGGQVRDIFSCLDFVTLFDIYGGGSFYDSCADFSYDGDFLGNSSLSKGYIRLPEVGGSRYDDACRCVSYSRIISLGYGEEPDLSFIDIDLSVVLEEFTYGVLENGSSSVDIVGALEEYGIDGGAWVSTVDKAREYSSRDVSSIIMWAEGRALLYSTVFLRELALFMMANPQWFGSFTGLPKDRYSVAGNVGLE